MVISGSPTPIGTDIFAFKSFVNVGDGASGHLTTDGIASRLLQSLGENENEARVLRQDAHTSADMLAEEEAFVEVMMGGVLSLIWCIVAKPPMQPSNCDLPFTCVCTVRAPR
jgi:hypothetical protein